jgi:hypothetical protein
MELVRGDQDRKLPDDQPRRSPIASKTIFPSPRLTLPQPLKHDGNPPSSHQSYANTALDVLCSKKLLDKA